MSEQSTEVQIINKLDKISQDITEIKTDIAVMKSRLDGQQKAIDKIPDLAEKVSFNLDLKHFLQFLTL